MIIAQKDDVVIRELRVSDIPKLAEYSNNQKVSINLRDAFPSPYTKDDAVRFVEMAAAKDPKTIFAIQYKGDYV
jgi:RimJ/RimL family protein N-acetyltransferase